jgi:uncharacterized protein YbjT (DUF2867 family)
MVLFESTRSATTRYIGGGTQARSLVLRADRLDRVLGHEQPVAAEKGVGASVTMADVGVLASKDEHVDPELASQRIESGTIWGCSMTASACTGA